MIKQGSAFRGDGSSVPVERAEERSDGLRSIYELLGLKSRFAGNPMAAGFVGVCALHGIVGTILPSGPLSAIAARIRLLRFVGFFGGA